MKNVDFNELIPELKRGNHGKGIDIRSWLYNVASYELAAAFGWLFWPEFTIHDDCVFFANFSEEGYQSFMESTGGNKESVESVMNHLHIWDLFHLGPEDPSDDLIRYFGRLLEEMWSCKLARDFPERQIVVSFWEGEDNDLVDPQITFFQKRDGRAADTRQAGRLRH